MIGLIYEIAVARDFLLDGFTAQQSSAGVENEEWDIFVQYHLTDITLGLDSQIKILQCKATKGDYTIQKAHIKTIVKKAAQQLKRIRDSGDERPVSQFLIVTNRRLGDGVENLRTDLGSMRDELPNLPPRCLRDGEDQRIEEWCNGLFDDGQEAVGVLAANALEILRVAEYRFIDLTELDARFNQSLLKLGLTNTELGEVKDLIGGAITNAMAETKPMLREIKTQVYVEESQFHDLCNSSLLPYEDEASTRLWANLGFEIERNQIDTKMLPRSSLVGDLDLALMKMCESQAARVLAIEGGGGHGKSQLAFRIPSRVREVDREHKHLFVFLDAEANLADPLENAISRSYFVGYKFDRPFYPRLRSAATICEDDALFWLLIPNADVLDGNDLNRLLASVQEDKLRVILTARGFAWDYVQSFDRDTYSSLHVDGLDKEELFRWFVEQGIAGADAANAGVSGTDVGSLNIVTSRIIEHPLAFRALIAWIGRGGNTHDDLKELFNLGAEALQSFMTVLKEECCARAKRKLGLSDAVIKQAFDDLWTNREVLPQFPMGRWAELFDGVDPQSSPLLVRQFCQIGVLDYHNPGVESLSWAIRYYPDGIYDTGGVNP